MKQIPFWRVAADILALYEADQKMRSHALSHDGFWEESVDFRSSSYIAQLVVYLGWPRRSQIGTRALHALGLLVRHADHNARLQRHCLELMMDIDRTDPGEVDRRDMAHLVDRICVNCGRSQIYGTQHTEVGDQYVPHPILDERHVNSRRKQMGLPTLQEGIARMYRKYGPPQIR